ncbi:solute carrier family 25 member 45-like isoform X5 [Lycorma delicatula]|uniref:solute carrier family 25 member 45-like isoform X5 n=1 Tax=Lycorma delicatula TaxID=130591 RepID=UPI003F5152A3
MTNISFSKHLFYFSHLFCYDADLHGISLSSGGSRFKTLSGICGLLVGHPLDTIKVKQQTSEVRRNAFKVAHAVLKSEGPIGFYRGLFMPLLSAGVLNSVFFGTYGNTLRFCANYRDEKFKRTCCDTLNNVPTYKYFHWDVFLAGCVAGTFTTVGLCPFELAKIKLQTQYEQLKKFKMKDKNFVKYSGSFDCLTKLFKAGGFKYIFKGLVPMIWRDSSSSGFYMYIYVSGNEIISETKTISSIMITGALAGAASWALIMPLDVVKSRMQADSVEKPKYNGMIDCFRKSYQEAGLKVFMRGFWTTMARALPVNAATFVGYETFISFYFKLKKKNEDQK